MKQWQRRIIDLDWQDQEMSALQIRQSIVGKGATASVPNTRQIGHFLKRNKNYEIVGRHNGVRIYRRINNEISKNSVGGGL